MALFALSENPVFPDPSLSDPDGLLAVGGDLSPARLLAAYRAGIFPWPIDGWPLLWHAPKTRFVLDPARLHVRRTLHKVLKQHRFSVTLDTAFAEVIGHCSQFPRPGQDGTWITADMVAAYRELHRLGYAHSAEAWREGRLVGGLYGVSLGAAFFGESMFALEDNASKVVFVKVMEQLRAWRFTLVDCQIETPLLAEFGATLVSQSRFQEMLRDALQQPTGQGPWRLAE